jgi:hypothetical protein
LNRTYIRIEPFLWFFALENRPVFELGKSCFELAYIGVFSSGWSVRNAHTKERIEDVPVE